MKRSIRNRTTDRKVKQVGIKRSPKKLNVTEDFKSRFLDNLIVKKQELEETIKYLLNNQKEDMGKISNDSFIDDLDRADREISTQSFYRFLERKNKELERINFLINRIQQEHEFGFCEECGRQIPEKRLLIMPEAVYCVPCQQELEKLELRMNMTKIPHDSSHWKKELRSNRNEDIDDEGFFIKPDTERVSLMDMEEIELAEDQPEPEESNP